MTDYELFSTAESREQLREIRQAEWVRAWQALDDRIKSMNEAEDRVREERGWN